MEHYTYEEIGQELTSGWGIENYSLKSIIKGLTATQQNTALLVCLIKKMEVIEFYSIPENQRLYKLYAKNKALFLEHRELLELKLEGCPHLWTLMNGIKGCSFLLFDDKKPNMHYLLNSDLLLKRIIKHCPLDVKKWKAERIGAIQGIGPKKTKEIMDYISKLK